MTGTSTRTLVLALCGMLFLTAATTPARTGFIQFSVDDLGGGIFQYDLRIRNFRKCNLGEPVSGLNILHGESVFGLNHFSVIGALFGWSFPEFVALVQRNSLLLNC